MFKNRDWFVLGLVGGVALLLAYWGFSRCIGVDCAPEPAWKLFEKSLHLVQGRGSFSIGNDPWQLVVAQYLVPGVAVLAAAKLFLLSLRRDLRVAFARKSSNHTVVCGLSETGRHIVENLRNAGERVVAIDLDSDTPAAAACAQAGVPVLKGDATSAKILRLAGAHRAKAIVATTGSDSTNLEISLRANDLESARHLVVLPELRATVGFGIPSPIISAPHWAPRRWRSDLSTPATIQRGCSIALPPWRGGGPRLLSRRRGFSCWDSAKRARRWLNKGCEQRSPSPASCRNSWWWTKKLRPGWVRVKQGCLGFRRWPP